MPMMPRPFLGSSSDNLRNAPATSWFVPAFRLATPDSNRASVESCGRGRLTYWKAAYPRNHNVDIKENANEGAAASCGDAVDTLRQDLLVSVARLDPERRRSAAYDVPPHE
jgi:hypothetical protein